jgi:hypothetical protein
MATASKISSDSSSSIVRDKRGLGLLLVSVSSVLSLAIVGLVAAQLMVNSPEDMMAIEAEALQNFTTAAGAEEPAASPKK